MKVVRKRLPAPASSPPSVPVTNGTWRLSEKGAQSLQHFTHQVRSKHGLYAAVPMVCRGSACPYNHSCIAYQYGDAPVGEPCTREISIILHKLEEYCKALDIDETNMIDLSLVKDLIDAEIMILRAESLIAKEGSIVEDIDVSVNPRTGDIIQQPAVTKPVELLERWMGTRHKILNQLNATRKDKAKEGVSSNIDPSKFAARLMKMAAEDNSVIIDVETQESEG